VAATTDERPVAETGPAATSDVGHPVLGHDVLHRVLVEERVEPLGPEGEGRDHLARRHRLPGPVTTPLVDQVDHAVGQHLGVHAPVTVAAEAGEQGVEDGRPQG
jgi:hypothetical protein